MFSVIIIPVCLEWRVSSLSKGAMPSPLLYIPHACCFAFVSTHQVPVGDDGGLVDDDSADG